MSRNQDPSAPALDSGNVIIANTDEDWNVLRDRPEMQTVAAVLTSDDTWTPRVRAWWPAISLSADLRVAGAVADQLTAVLPTQMLTAAPEASVVLAGALHAASMVDWPPVTVTHLLDSGSIATFVELLAGSGADDMALDVSAAAGALSASRNAVLAAAAFAARPLVVEQHIISPPVSAAVRGPGPWYELRCSAARPLVCIDARTALGRIVADRALYLGAVAGRSPLPKNGPAA